MHGDDGLAKPLDGSGLADGRRQALLPLRRGCDGPQREGGRRHGFRGVNSARLWTGQCRGGYSSTGLEPSRVCVCVCVCVRVDAWRLQPFTGLSVSAPLLACPTACFSLFPPACRRSRWQWAVGSSKGKDSLPVTGPWTRHIQYVPAECMHIVPIR